ncbi:MULTISPECIES: MerR family transcriptional regulator [unclassified Sphingopyxis]|uniref:MerR family transcriptional regulator n=1 Tax=unclassified Sphingopyxis TaxID=2614943 RepID=UPI00285539C3|nr:MULTISPECIES: MerR family transcriptional regulator [unclassified Sphingopyxis]MDR6834107.1 DNA-binding transcriptional MerR regulator [Sphingopyxis sp. BE122]MDR7226375.1 DNA-binding transcriptional MerR regulator [Sphingopyxis sp. BE259]
MKMRDLERRTGVHRETIRVYFRNGLLPEPSRPATNVADYDDSHVQAVLAVRKLQRDDGLTLPQIKEALRGQNGEGRVDAAAFRNLEALVAARVGFEGEVLIETLARDWPNAEADARVFESLGIVEIRDTKKGPALSIMDSRLVTIWQLMRAEGYTEENGFPASVVDFYAGPADEIARAESQRFIEATEGRMDDGAAAALFHAGIRHMIDFFGLLRLKRLMTYIHFDDVTGHVDAARRDANGPPR